MAKHDLSGIRVDKIDLVGMAANRKSILLFKSAGGKDVSDKKLDLTSLPEDVQKFVADLEKQAAQKAVDTSKLPQDVQDHIAALQKQITGVKKEEKKDDKTPEITPELVLKALGLKPAEGGEADKVWEGVPEGVRKGVEALGERLEKAEKEGKETAEKLAKVEEEGRRQKFMKEASVYKDLPQANPDDLGPILMKAHETLTEDQYKRLTTILKSSDEAIRESMLYAEIGSGASGTGSAYAEVASAAEELQKSDTSLTPEQARARILKSRPDLAKKVSREEDERKRA